MTLRPLGFRRLVLGLQPGAPSERDRARGRTREPLRPRADRALHRRRRLAPSGRDARGARHQRARRGLELARIWHGPGEADYAAESAGRRFAEASRRLERRRFEIVRGAAAQAIAAISRPEDILVIVPPAAAADRAAEPFASLLEAAFASPAAVMLAPARIARGWFHCCDRRRPGRSERRRRRRYCGRDGRKPCRSRHAPGRRRGFAPRTEERHRATIRIGRCTGGQLITSPKRRRTLFAG